MQLPAEFTALHPYSWREQFAYEAVAMGYLTARRGDPTEAAAILGNLEQESALNPRAIRRNDAGPGKDSMGIEQDNRERLANMEAFVSHLVGKHYAKCTDQELFYGQLAFLLHELVTTHKHASDVLRRGRGSQTLASDFGHLFEGFGTASGPARNEKAVAILNRYRALHLSK